LHSRDPQKHLFGGAMSFGGRLKALRQGAGLSRAALARRAGVPAGTLRHWEGGRGFPGLAACLRLAKALGVSVERLAQGVEDPADEEPESAPQKPRRARRRKPP
jgi:transcriptional regulator with XRE-family HTH domain